MERKRYLKILLLAMALLSLASLIALQRLHTYHEPLERDITLYAVFGHELLKGRNLYSDLWDIKPPAIYITYAAAEKLIGYGPRQVYFLGLIAAVIALLGVYKAGSALRGRTITGLWAAAFWTVLCSDPALQANQPNTEVFMNACLIWTFTLLVRARSDASGLGRFCIIGLLFALASLYKPVAAVTAIILCLVYLTTSGPLSKWPRAAMQVALIGGIGLVSWIGTCAYFYATRRFSPFYDTMFIYNRFYAGDFWKNIKDSLRPGYLVPPPLRLTALAMAPAGFGMLLGLSKTPRRSWLLFLGWALGTQISIMLPGKFFPHYYQLWLPLMAVFAAWGIEEIELSSLHLTWLPVALGAAALLIIGVHEQSFYKYSGEELSRLKYSEIFVASAKTGRELGQLLAPGETFYEWGFETGLYFYSRRRPPTGVLDNEVLMKGPLVSDLSAQVLKELDRTHPELFLTLENKDSALFIVDPRPLPPVLQWAKSRYRFFTVRYPFVLYVRKGSRLEARLSPEATHLPFR